MARSVRAIMALGEPISAHISDYGVEPTARRLAAFP